MMKKRLTLLLVFSLLSASYCAFGSSSSLSVDRRLLQILKPCPLSFEYRNYNIITSRCKGPSYPVSLCCSAFIQFACPFAAELNDLSNNCASTMFSYINLYGNYPPGLFSNECRGGVQGLECPAPSPSASPSSNAANTTSDGGSGRSRSAAAFSLAPLLLLLLHSMFETL